MVRMRLHILLAEHEMSQKDLAKATNIRYATVNKYANNKSKHIVISHINILCDYFNCNISDLIQYTDDVKD